MRSVDQMEAKPSPARGDRCHVVNSEIKQAVSKIICDVLKVSPATLADTENLRQLESVDSINLVRVMARIEEHFDIELEDELVFEVTTLDELVAAVGKLLPAQAAH
jgi:acyl carrier protein